MFRGFFIESLGMRCGNACIETFKMATAFHHRAICRGERTDLPLDGPRSINAYRVKWGLPRCANGPTPILPHLWSGAASAPRPVPHPRAPPAGDHLHRRVDGASEGRPDPLRRGADRGQVGAVSAVPRIHGQTVPQVRLRRQRTLQVLQQTRLAVGAMSARPLVTRRRNARGRVVQSSIFAGNRHPTSPDVSGEN